MRSIRITDVRALPGDSAFLIDDGKTTILYDTGFAFTGYRVLERIKTALKDRALDYIFLTHSHYDHALGSVYIKEYYKNAKVVAGTYAQKIFGKESAKAVMRDLDKKFAIKNGVSEYADLIDNLSVDIPVNDGDIISAGDMTFKVVELPGHTRCSIGFYCEEKNLLLGSETIGVYNGCDGVVPSFLVGYEMTLSSIEKVQKLNIDNILVPHYGLIDREKTELYLKKAKESAISTAESISSMLKSGHTKEECLQYVKDRFYHGYIKTIYPLDAMELNTSIMIDLIQQEYKKR